MKYQYTQDNSMQSRVAHIAIHMLSAVPKLLTNIKNASIATFTLICISSFLMMTAHAYDTDAQQQTHGSDDAARQIMSGNVPTFTNNDIDASWQTNSWQSYGQTYGNYSQPYYDDLYTGSRGVLVVDLHTNKSIYDKDADIARPIASISKLMTAMVVLDAQQDMAENIYMEREDFIGPKKASSRLRVGDRLNRAELLLITLMKSENPAAKALARHYPGGYHAFMSAMNAKAQSLGMHSAYFGDPTGLDKNNVASPRDLVKMVKAAGEYNVIRSFSTTKSYDFYLDTRVVSARNTSYLVRDGLYDIGVSKTGYIREAGRCVVMETMVSGRPAIVVILGARTSKTRWEDAENIMGFLYRKFKHA